MNCQGAIGVLDRAKNRTSRGAQKKTLDLTRLNQVTLVLARSNSLMDPPLHQCLYLKKIPI